MDSLGFLTFEMIMIMQFSKIGLTTDADVRLDFHALLCIIFISHQTRLLPSETEQTLAVVLAVASTLGLPLSQRSCVRTQLSSPRH